MMGYAEFPIGDPASSCQLFHVELEASWLCSDCNIWALLKIKVIDYWVRCPLELPDLRIPYALQES